MDAYSEIRYSVADAVATVTLSRPAKLNAFTPVMKNELLDAYDKADGDDDVRAVVVTGDGRAFCAGADISPEADSFASRARASTGEAPRDGGGEISLRVFESRKPVIAAINGHAVGIGLTMTLPMDIRVVSEDAKLGFVFVRRGIVPEAASSWFLPRIVGPSQAAEWVLSGRIFDAREALAGGLVRSVHASEDVLDVALGLAREIADNAAPVSVALSRRLLWRGLTFDSPYQSHVADSRGIDQRGRSADATEGIAAFLDKRPADYPDRVSSDLPDLFSDPQPSWAADLLRQATTMQESTHG
jgi:enoyl-CoA hydratase/carnithine racemase